MKHMKRFGLMFVAVLLLSSPVFAVDGSIMNSHITITGAKTVRITNITVDGLPGTFWAEFSWDAQLLAFKLIEYGADLNDGSESGWRGGKAKGAPLFTADGIDGSIANAQSTIAGVKTIKITNITIFGLPGVYWGKFSWDTQLLAFKLFDYGAVWREVQVDADYDMDEIIDEVTTYAYDEQGRLITQTNNDLSDVDDEIATFRYDAEGRLIRDELDVWPYGSIDEVGTYTYDANGRLLSREEDSGNNGTIDAVETYTYDGSGRIIGRQEDSDNNGTIDERETYTYDANGNIISGRADTDNDGTIDEAYTFTYDANNNAVGMEYDSGNNGSIDATGTFSYDANGNLSREEYDNDNNGTIDERYTHTWERGPCWIGGLEDIIVDLKILGLICN